ncbi:MAG: LysR family transcriptional regulator [Acidimicrobiia bacterium]
MEIRQLQALLAVAEHGSFSAAAEALSTVQSNISAHIARLEREVGATLVDRHGGRLTEEGLAVAARAERIAYELEALRADVSALRADVTGTARFGVIGTTARWLVPMVLQAMEARHPKVELVVVEATSTSLEPQLANGRLDLAVVNLPLPAGDLVTEALFDEDLVLFVPSSHELAGRESVALGELADLPLLLPPRGVGFRDEIESAVAKSGAELKIKAELDGIRLIASLAIGGFGAAILPATAIPTWLRGDWAVVPVVDLPPRRVGLAQRRRGLPSPAARALLEVIREAVVPGPDVPLGVNAPA